LLRRNSISTFPANPSAGAQQLFNDKATHFFGVEFVVVSALVREMKTQQNSMHANSRELSALL
jgi:hypothetical protein